MYNLIIIQARLSSTRLPGKVLKPIWGDKSLLDLQVEAINELEIPFVLATSTSPSDDALSIWANRKEVPCFRGNEQNVLERFIDCANQYKADNLIRVCSDNPFIQLDQIEHYLKRIESGVDYISYCNRDDKPAIKTHWGLFIEGVSFAALKKAQELLADHPEKAFYSEHVTNFVYGHSDIFRVELEMAPDIIVKRNDLRFTIDTQADFDNMHSLLQLAGPETNLDQLIEIVDTNPTIKSVMRQGIDQFSK